MTNVDSGRTIRRARANDKAQLCITIATALTHGPIARWLLPDPSQRLGACLGYTQAVFDRALSHGLIHTTNSHAGAAIWFPRAAAAQATEPAGPDVPATGRAARLEAIMSTLPPDEPHHHLALLGVDPVHHRRGLGGALLRHHHRALDAEAIPAFLVAASAGSRDLCLRHGYVVREERGLPDGPPLWAMWREPLANRG